MLLFWFDEHTTAILNFIDIFYYQPQVYSVTEVVSVLRWNLSRAVMTADSVVVGRVAGTVSHRAWSSSRKGGDVGGLMQYGTGKSGSPTLDSLFVASQVTAELCKLPCVS